MRTAGPNHAHLLRACTQPVALVDARREIPKLTQIPAAVDSGPRRLAWRKMMGCLRLLQQCPPQSKTGRRVGEGRSRAVVSADDEACAGVHDEAQDEAHDGVHDGVHDQVIVAHPTEVPYRLSAGFPHAQLAPEG